MDFLGQAGKLSGTFASEWGLFAARQAIVSPRQRLAAELAAIRLMSTAHGRCYATRPRVCMTKCAGSLGLLRVRARVKGHVA